MNVSQIYIFIAVAALVAIAVLLLVASRFRKEQRLTPLAGLAFGFILASVLFGDDRLIGYGLMAIGLILAVIDIFRKRN